MDYFVPLASRVDQINYVKEAENLENVENGYEEKILLPLSVCNQIIEHLASNDDEFAIINEEYLYSIGEVESCLRIHKVRDIQKSIEKEKLWFEKSKVFAVPTHLKRISQQSIRAFQSVLLEGKDECAVEIQNPALHTSDLATIVGSGWITLSVIDFFLCLLNKNTDDAFSITLSGLKDLQSDGNRLKETLKSWSEKSISVINIIANVGINNFTKKTYFANARAGLVGNHWACISVIAQKSVLLYCDSLAWDAPEDIFDKLNFLLSQIQAQPFTLRYVNSTSSLSSTVVNQNIFPYQGLNQNMCGIASIFSAVLVSNENIRQCVLAKNDLPKEFEWLGKIYNYNYFTRTVLMKWYQTKAIKSIDIGIKMTKVILWTLRTLTFFDKN